jgi:hypothetical protein
VTLFMKCHLMFYFAFICVGHCFLEVYLEYLGQVGLLVGQTDVNAEAL